MRLQGKVALVTGAGMGIGQAVALAYAREGARIVAADINEIAGQATVQRIRDSGGEASFHAIDVSKQEDAQRAVAAALAAYGRLDILVNSAGVYARGTVVDTSLETWNRLLSINLTGVFLCCQAAIPALRLAGGGAIVNVSSSVGWQNAAPNVACYVATKFGVTGLTKAMACDYLKDRIRVNCLCPGPTDTPLIRGSRSIEALQEFVAAQPIGRLGLPEEIAAAAVFLASDESSFVTGVALPVDGGQTAQV